MRLDVLEYNNIMNYNEWEIIIGWLSPTIYDTMSCPHSCDMKPTSRFQVSLFFGRAIENVETSICHHQMMLQVLSDLQCDLLTFGVYEHPMRCLREPLAARKAAKKLIEKDNPTAIDIDLLEFCLRILELPTA